MKPVKGLHSAPPHISRPVIFAFCTVAILTGCSDRSTLHKYEFQDGHYLFKQKGRGFEKAYIVIKEDSVLVLPAESAAAWEPDAGKDQIFLKKSFDFDILTVPFKYRPSSFSFPRQLNANANGNAMMGLRLDRFRIQLKKTPAGLKKFQTHRGVSVGGFLGLGSAAITPWTTNYRTTDEYEGLVLTRGVAAMIGVNNLTFGIGTGWDYLTDRDKSIWIYQNRAWYGVTLGLNLN